MRYKKKYKKALKDTFNHRREDSVIAFILLFLSILSYYTILISPYFWILFIIVSLVLVLFCITKIDDIKEELWSKLNDERYFEDGHHQKFFFYMGKKTNQVKSEFTLLNGLRNGSYKEYFFGNGKIKVKSNYVNGKLEGFYEEYYENGNHRKVSNYLNGKLEGDYKEYHQNGEIKLETSFLDDMQHGKTKVYFSNGSIYRVSNMERGQFIGEIKEFHKNGFIKFTGLNSRYRFYHQNRIDFEIEFNNKPTGVWNKFREDGTIEYQLLFESDNSDTLKKSIFSESGKVQKTQNLQYKFKNFREISFINKYALKRMESETTFVGGGLTTSGNVQIRSNPFKVKIHNINSIEDLIDINETHLN